jgi:hypothetical protein
VVTDMAAESGTKAADEARRAESDAGRGGHAAALA